MLAGRCGSWSGRPRAHILYEKGGVERGNGKWHGNFKLSKYISSVNTSSHKASSPTLPQTALPRTGNQVFKCLSLWKTVHSDHYIHSLVFSHELLINSFSLFLSIINYLSLGTFSSNAFCLILAINIMEN